MGHYFLDLQYYRHTDGHTDIIVPRNCCVVLKNKREKVFQAEPTFLPGSIYVVPAKPETLCI